MRRSSASADIFPFSLNSARWPAQLCFIVSGLNPCHIYFESFPVADACGPACKLRFLRSLFVIVLCTFFPLWFIFSTFASRFAFSLPTLISASPLWQPLFAWTSLGCWYDWCLSSMQFHVYLQHTVICLQHCVIEAPYIPLFSTAYQAGRESEL